MSFWNGFPFSNFHELNLDWIIEKVVECVKRVDEGEENIDKGLKKIGDTLATVPTVATSATYNFLNNMIDSGELGEICGDYYASVSYLDTIKNKKILIIGDSLSDETAERCWVKKFKTLVSGKNVVIRNNSHSGDALAEQWAVLQAQTDNFVPDIVIIWCGVNDVKKQTTLESLNTTLDSIRDKLQDMNIDAQVYLFSTYKNYRVLPEQWIIPQIAYWRFYEQYAEQNGWSFVDMFANAPKISPETADLRTHFYEEKDSGFLHYTVAYSETLARYILNILCTQMSVPLGDYWERINGSYLDGAGVFNNKTEFEPNLNGSHIRFGSRFVKVRIAGTFKPSNPASGKYVRIAKLPSYMIPASTIYSLAFRGGGWDEGGGANATFGTLLDSDGSICVHTLAKEGTSYTSLTIYCDFYIFDLSTDWQRKQSLS